MTKKISGRSIISLAYLKRCLFASLSKKISDLNYIICNAFLMFCNLLSKLDVDSRRVQHNAMKNNRKVAL